jgi:hypothetical protein
MCEICEEMPADDGPSFLQCSFCNLSFCNTPECLGSAGGAILSKRDAENEKYEWACPRLCWEVALAKVRRATLRLVTKSVVAGKKTTTTTKKKKGGK